MLIPFKEFVGKEDEKYIVASPSKLNFYLEDHFSDMPFLSAIKSYSNLMHEMINCEQHTAKANRLVGLFNSIGGMAPEYDAGNLRGNNEVLVGVVRDALYDALHRGSKTNCSSVMGRIDRIYLSMSADLLNAYINGDINGQDEKDIKQAIDEVLGGNSDHKEKKPVLMLNAVRDYFKMIGVVSGVEFDDGHYRLNVLDNGVEPPAQKATAKSFGLQV